MADAAASLEKRRPAAFTLRPVLGSKLRLRAPYRRNRVLAVDDLNLLPANCTNQKSDCARGCAPSVVRLVRRPAVTQKFRRFESVTPAQLARGNRSCLIFKRSLARVETGFPTGRLFHRTCASRDHQRTCLRKAGFRWREPDAGSRPISKHIL